jgi:hypothetical protein
MFKITIKSTKPTEIFKIVKKESVYSVLLNFRGLINHNEFKSKVTFIIKIKKDNKFKIKKIRIENIRIPKSNDDIDNLMNPYLISSSISTSSSSLSENINIKIYNLLKRMIKDINIKKDSNENLLNVYLIKPSEISKLKLKGIYKEN